MRPDRLLALLLMVALAGCGSSPSREGRAGSAAKERQSAAELNVSLGQGYLEQGQLEIALEKLNRALELDPRLDYAHTVIAVVYERIGDNEKAGFHYKRAVDLSPAKGALLNNYGTFLCRRGRHAEADALFERALKDPFYDTPAVAHANRGSCALAWGRADAAEQHLRRAIELQPDQPDALFQLAELSAAKGDNFRARAFLQRYEALAPASPASLKLAMLIEQKLGNTVAARDYRRRLIDEFPDSDLAQQARTEEKSP